MLKRLLIGAPLATSQLLHERITKIKGLAIFSSDALSSTAYATEEILIVLVAGGAAALSLALPVAIVITTVLAIVATSYYQTIHAYPSGGGAYIVSKDNLGLWPGLVAAAALLIDYVLTVSVSISAGIAAITSAVPALHDSRVALALLAIALVATLNLRGVRESGTIFAAPTYLFIACLGVMIAVGLGRAVGQPPIPPSVEAGTPLASISLYMILRAFSSGSTAMTGVEAISNGIPAFQPPSSRNAGITLIWMAVILGTLFLGVTYLAQAFGVVPRESETVVSQVARHLFGTGPMYFAIQAATAMILILAANTSFAGFPLLASILARDGFLPRQLANLGDRLVYANGIMLLALFSGLLVYVFNANTTALIPLYAIGVFISFTLSQAGMVRRWWKLRAPGWRRNLVINGIGAVATAIVLGVVVQAKFLDGAWIVLLLIPAYVGMMYKIHRHYEEVRRELTLEGVRLPGPIRHHKVVVPVGGMHRGVVAALRYAKSVSDDVVAVTVNIDDRLTEDVQRKWEQWGMGVPLIVLQSPYRSVIQPFLRYLDTVEMEADFDEPITLVVPEFVPAKFWHFLLHGQSALVLKIALLFRRRSGHRIVVVTNVPYYFSARQDAPARDDHTGPLVRGPIATVGAVLVLTLGGLVVATTQAWPFIVQEVLGILAVVLVGVLFYLLLLKSIF